MSLASVVASPTFLRSLSIAFLSGASSVFFRFLDVDLGYDFLDEWNPEFQVFSLFCTFASLVAGFRTAHALQRYTEAASLLHRLLGCWHDVASTLIAFCRTSRAAKEDIDNFQNTLLRLVSLLSAICLEHLEHKNSGHSNAGHRFEVMGWVDLDENTQSTFAQSPCKVEHTFQMLYQLVVDAMDVKVLDIAAPILTRSFQELGSGLLIYHEAKKLSYTPLPYAYSYLTYVILVCQAVLTPFMLAANSQGFVSAFWYTFVTTYLLWFVNGVADTLDNPFRKEARTLELSLVQSELNIQLKELLVQGQQESPGIRTKALDIDEDLPNIRRQMTSMRAFRQHLHQRFSRVPSAEPERYESGPTSSSWSILNSMPAGLGIFANSSSRSAGGTPRNQAYRASGRSSASGGSSAGHPNLVSISSGSSAGRHPLRMDSFARSSRCSVASGGSYLGAQESGAQVSSGPSLVSAMSPASTLAATEGLAAQRQVLEAANGADRGLRAGAPLAPPPVVSEGRGDDASPPQPAEATFPSNLPSHFPPRGCGNNSAVTGHAQQMDLSSPEAGAYTSGVSGWTQRMTVPQIEYQCV